jgi:tripartite-type tricarboxylate transporter receptor subunit TctC
VASSKNSEAMLDQWNKELVKVLSDKEIIAALKEHGLYPSPGTREDLRKYIAKDSQIWAKIIQERHITNE